MNSSLMFKKSVSILLALLTLLTACLSLCSCSKKVVYKIHSMSWISEETALVITEYTYTEDNKPASVEVIHPLDPLQDYKDVYSYNKWGKMISCTRTYDNMRIEEYTPKKITNNKYILYDKNQKEFLTIVFDDSGFIVSTRYATGSITEYSFTNDENGRPISFKQFDVRPSGSQRLIDYTVEFKSEDTFRMYATGEHKNDDEYYEVKYQKIDMKG